MIEVGEYVRLESGIHNGIRKIVGRDEDDHLLIDISFTGARWLTFTEEAEIEKHSKNIIDLIEVGDYVNGEKVFSIEKDRFIKGQIDIFVNRDEVNYWGDRSLSLIIDKDIKSIVTKEQFANMEYRLEENKC